MTASPSVEGLGSSRHASVRGLFSGRDTGSRAWWNTIRPFVLSVAAVGGASFGVFLLTQGASYAVALWIISFFVSILSLVGIGRDWDRRRKLKAWLRTTDVQHAIRGAEEARQRAVLSPPWLQAAYYVRREELRRLPLPKESLRALRTGAPRKKDDGFTFTGCCGPR